MLYSKKTQERDQNILEYHHIVARIAKRLKTRLPDHVDIEDLKSVGFIGLIEAIDRYDSSRGVPFRSYAEIRIQGAMLDYLRKQDWVPRSIRRRMKILAAAKEEIRKKGLEVNDGTLADQLHMSVSDLQDLLFDSQVRRLISSHTPIESSGGQGCFIEDLLPCPDGCWS